MIANAVRKKLCAVAPSLLWAWLACWPASGNAGDKPHASGVIGFTVSTVRGPLSVRAFLPERGSGEAPVWVVMHGQRRNAETYFKDWLEQARENEAVLIVPEFDKAHWPTSMHYPLGNVMTTQGTTLRADEWAFTAVDRAVDEALRRGGRASASARFSLYGHGAGAQFVQRYVLHTGARRVRTAIAANAGWYLLPDASFDFPYGLRNLPLSEGQLREAFAAPLVILLGHADLRTDGVMRRNAQTDAQGPDRLSRGRFFVERGRAVAGRNGMELNWRLQEVPDAGHSDADMMHAALALLRNTPALRQINPG